jgi:hypothetical protein
VGSEESGCVVAFQCAFNDRRVETVEGDTRVVDDKIDTTLAVGFSRWLTSSLTLVLSVTSKGWNLISDRPPSAFSARACLSCAS